MSNKTITDAEREAFQILNRELDQHLLLNQSAYNLIGMMISVIPERPIIEMPLSFRVAATLLVRLTNDLRSVSLLTMRGYPTQALSIGASMYETAYTIAYIKSNNELAKKWKNHDDPIKPFEKIIKITKEGLANLGAKDPEKQASIEYKVYRQLCMAKHINPIYQKQHGYQLVDSCIVATTGPDTSEPAIRAAWYALEKSAGFILIALHSFILNHVPFDSKRRLIREFNKLSQHYKVLNDAAKKRWGTKDPYPGKW